MAKTRINSAKDRPSSGEVQANDVATRRDPLQHALEVIGRKPRPLEPTVFLRHEIVLQCRAVVAWAGLGASDDELAQAASEVLREIITKIRDDTDRHVAEGAFATDKNYEGKQIGQRQEVLLKHYGITKDIYAVRRPLVFASVAYELRTYHKSPPVSGIVVLDPSRVGATATCLYYASIATKVLIEGRLRVLGDNAAPHEPNLPLYSAHVAFLLTAHRYLHTIDPIEDVAKPELVDIFQRTIAHGPLRDVVYLAHIYGGRDKPAYPRDSPNSEADRMLRVTWKQWYERQEASGGADGTDLHLLSLAVLEFRYTLPTLSGPDSDIGFYPSELEPALQVISAILHEAITYKAPAQPGGRSSAHKALSDVIDTEEARDKWLHEMNYRIEMKAHRELKNIKVTKRWDDLIAMRLHSGM